MDGLLKSLAFSLIASVAGTYLLRRILSAESSGASGGDHVNPVTVVVVPVLVGNSGNHFFELRMHSSPLSKLELFKRR